MENVVKCKVNVAVVKVGDSGNKLKITSRLIRGQILRAFVEFRMVEYFKIFSLIVLKWFQK